MIFAVVETPFTVEFKLFSAEDNKLELIKLAVVVVETFPFTVETKVKAFVEVDIVKRLVVPELITDCKSVVVATPFTVEVSVVPDTFKPFDVMIEVVAIIPLIFVERILPATF